MFSNLASRALLFISSFFPGSHEPPPEDLIREVEIEQLIEMVAVGEEVENETLPQTRTASHPRPKPVRQAPCKASNYIKQARTISQPSKTASRHPSSNRVRAYLDESQDRNKISVDYAALSPFEKLQYCRDRYDRVKERKRRARRV